MVRPERDLVHARRKGQSLQWTLNEARPPPSRVGLMATRWSGRAGDGVGLEVDTEAVLGEQAGGVAHRRHLGHHLEAGLVQRLTGGAVGVGRVTHDLGLVVVVFVSLDQLVDGVAVGRVGRADGHLVDELGIGVDGQVGLVPVEAAVARLVTVAGLGVDRRDEPVLGHLVDDAKDPVVALFCVLAGDEGQQVGGGDGPDRQGFAVDGTERAQGVAHQGVDEGVAGTLVVPVARRLADGVVLVVAPRAARTSSPSGLAAWSRATRSLRIAARSWVTVSWVATASCSGVESRTRARPFMAPVSLATTLVSSKRRRGRSDARRRLRWPTREVGWKAAYPVSTPQAACQRRSKLSRSVASASLKPSKAWSSITVAITRAGWSVVPGPTQRRDRRSSRRRRAGGRGRPAGDRANLPSADHRGSPSDSRSVAGPLTDRVPCLKFLPTGAQIASLWV